VTATGSAFARVALAGNPSDGYGGRTLAVVIRDFAAHAQVEHAEADEITVPGEGGEALMLATLERFRGHLGQTAPVKLSCETNVPREVGLAGSSAIVIACARALCDLHRAELERDELARLALAVETEDLGIAAGLQDRMVQARETLVAMDFGGHPVYEELDPQLLPPLYVAWHPGAAAPSGVAHGELRRRHEQGDPEVTATMERLAAHAASARLALLEGDHATFAGCVDASFDERLRIMHVDELTAAMVGAARAAGASANSAGSGGAIVGTLPDARTWPRLRDAFERLGASAIRPRAAC
jgi:galactokinase/mevalonate kinase-like predicted kinase